MACLLQACLLYQLYPPQVNHIVMILPPRIQGGAYLDRVANIAVQVVVIALAMVRIGIGEPNSNKASTYAIQNI